LVIKYLKDKNEDNSLNYVDSLLFIDLENDLKFSLMNETNVII